MGYGRALLARDTAKEQAELQKAGQKRGLFGSIGGTLLGGIATAVTGGMASPWAAGLIRGGAAGLGKLLGQKAAGDLPKGKFFQSDRASMENMFDQDIWGTMLTGAVTGGLGQKDALEAAGAAGKGLDFKGSFLGKGIDKVKTTKALKSSGIDIEGGKGWARTLGGTKLGGPKFDLDMVQGAMNQQPGALGNVFSKIPEGMSEEAYNRMISSPGGPMTGSGTGVYEDRIVE